MVCKNLTSKSDEKVTMKKYLFLPLRLLAASAHAENNGSENTTGNESETTGITILAPRDSVSSQTPKILRDMKPTMKFGGYIIGKLEDFKANRSRTSHLRTLQHSVLGT